MRNANGIEICMSSTAAAAADLATLTPGNDPHGLQRAALEGVGETPDHKSHNRTTAQRCANAIHLRAYLEACDELAREFFTEAALGDTHRWDGAAYRGLSGRVDLFPPSDEHGTTAWVDHAGNVYDVVVLDGDATSGHVRLTVMPRAE